ncbi:mCG144641, partial [Mus musculus]
RPLPHGGVARICPEAHHAPLHKLCKPGTHITNKLWILLKENISHEAQAQKPLRMLPELWRRVPNEAEERILNDEELLEARLGRADL